MGLRKYKNHALNVMYTTNTLDCVHLFLFEIDMVNSSQMLFVCVRSKHVLFVDAFDQRLKCEVYKMFTYFVGDYRGAQVFQFQKPEAALSILWM